MAALEFNKHSCVYNEDCSSNNIVMRIKKRKFHPQRCSNAVSLINNKTVKTTTTTTTDTDMGETSRVSSSTTTEAFKNLSVVEHRLHCPGSVDCCKCRGETGYYSRYPVVSSSTIVKRRRSCNNKTIWKINRSTIDDETKVIMNVEDTTTATSANCGVNSSYDPSSKFLLRNLPLYKRNISSSGDIIDNNSEFNEKVSTTSTTTSTPVKNKVTNTSLCNIHPNGGGGIKRRNCNLVITNADKAFITTDETSTDSNTNSKQMTDPLGTATNNDTIIGNGDGSSWRREFALKMHRFMTRFSGRRRQSRSRAFNWLPVVQWTRMTSFLYTFFIVVTTCLPNLPVSYACSSRSTPKPRPPSPTLRPNITIQTYTCPPEYDAHYCLNGATCFTVKIGESILYNCETVVFVQNDYNLLKCPTPRFLNRVVMNISLAIRCAEGYMGQRCEFKDLDGSYLPSKQRAMLEQAGVTGGAAIVVILVVCVCFYLYVRSRRKSTIRRSRRDVDATDGIDVDYERYERRPFSQFYYNNPSISISQSLHSPPTLQHQSDMSGRLEKVDIPLPSTSPPHHHIPKKVEPPDPQPLA